RTDPAWRREQGEGVVRGEHGAGHADLRPVPFAALQEREGVHGRGTGECGLSVKPRGADPLRLTFWWEAAKGFPTPADPRHQSRSRFSEWRDGAGEGALASPRVRPHRPPRPPRPPRRARSAHLVPSVISAECLTPSRVHSIVVFSSGWW